MKRIKPAIVALLVLALLPTAAVVASSTGQEETIHACVRPSGLLRVVENASDCRRLERSLSWKQTGPPVSIGAEGFRETYFPLFPLSRAGCFPADSLGGDPRPIPTTWEVPACGSERISELDLTMNSDLHPASTVAHFDLFISQSPDTEFCVRFFNVTLSTVLEGSEFCRSNPFPETLYGQIRSAPFALADGENTYRPEFRLRRADGTQAFGASATARGEIYLRSNE